MNFLTASGFSTPRLAALASVENMAPMVQGAVMLSRGAGREAPLQRITNTVCESAIIRHQVDFERVDRRCEALSHLKGTIIDLKSRLERRSSGRSRLVTSDGSLQLSYKAS